MQQVKSVYETDLFRPIIDAVAKTAGTAFGEDEAHDYALRVVADHARGATFLAVDGVVPGNEGRGYVMRRIVRRSVRATPASSGSGGRSWRAWSSAGHRPDGRPYPELRLRRDGIVETLVLEESRFADTLASGTERLNDWIEQAQGRGESEVAGRLLFMLHDSFGFPFELSEEMLAEAGLTADRAGFDVAMEAAEPQPGELGVPGRGRGQGVRGRRRARHDVRRVRAAGDPLARFLPCATVIRAVAELRQGQEGLIVLDQTAFYAEGGGQVGDQGIIRSADGIFRVSDTRRIDDRHIAHFGVVESGVVRGGARFRRRSITTSGGDAAPPSPTSCTADAQGRPGRKHRAEGLAGRAARRPLRLQLSARPERDQLEQINATINRHVLENLPVMWQVMDIDQARQAGAVAIFGEKYGSQVRVVDIGGWSKENVAAPVHRSATSARRSWSASRPRQRHPPREVLAANLGWPCMGAGTSACCTWRGWSARRVDQIEAKLTSLQGGSTRPAARRPNWSSSLRPAGDQPRGLGGEGGRRQRARPPRST